jgi:hypothetical protein
MRFRVGETVPNEPGEHLLRVVHLVALQMIVRAANQCGLGEDLSDRAPSQTTREASRRVRLRGIGIDLDRALEMSDRVRELILLDHPQAFVEGRRPAGPGRLGMSARKGNEREDGEYEPDDRARRPSHAVPHARYARARTPRPDAITLTCSTSAGASGMPFARRSFSHSASGSPAT